MAEQSQLNRIEAKLDALIARQERTESWQERTESRQDRMESWQERMESRQDRMEKTLDEHSAILDRHSVILEQHSVKLNEHSGLIQGLDDRLTRQFELMHEYWRSEFRALREQDRETNGQSRDFQAWRTQTEVRLDVLTTSYRSVDKRVSALEGKPGRKR